MAKWWVRLPLIVYHTKPHQYIYNPCKKICSAATVSWNNKVITEYTHFGTQCVSWLLVVRARFGWYRKKRIGGATGHVTQKQTLLQHFDEAKSKANLEMASNFAFTKWFLSVTQIHLLIGSAADTQRFLRLDLACMQQSPLLPLLCISGAHAQNTGKGHRKRPP